MPRFLMHETGVHYVDTFRYLLGPPDGVYADLRRLNPAIRGEDAGLFVLDYAGGARAVFDGNRLLDFPTDDPRRTFGTATLEGTEATLELAGDGRAAPAPPRRARWRGPAGPRVTGPASPATACMPSRPMRSTAWPRAARPRRRRAAISTCWR